MSVLGSQVFGQASMEGCVWLWWQIVWFGCCGCHCGGLLHIIPISTDTYCMLVCCLLRSLLSMAVLKVVVVVVAVVVIMEVMVHFQRIGP